MTKGIQITLGLAVLLVLAIIGWSAYQNRFGNTIRVTTPEKTFTINGERIELLNGVYEKEAAPGASAKITTSYFGNETKGDFDGDGKEDRAFLVTQTTGGSGTFFYLATTLGGEAAFLGDRIAPQTTEWRDGKIVVNYAERKPGEPMTASPSVGVSKYFQVREGTLTETPTQGNTPVTGTTSAAGGTTLTTGEKCTQEGGSWSSQYSECTGVDEKSCKAIGGTWNDCASPCRNDPNAEVCIMMCVSVCTFK